MSKDKPNQIPPGPILTQDTPSIGKINFGPDDKTQAAALGGNLNNVPGSRQYSALGVNSNNPGTVYLSLSSQSTNVIGVSKIGGDKNSNKKYIYPGANEDIFGPHPTTDGNEQDSFIRTRLNKYHIKRTRTPLFDVPQQEKMDAKLDEIGKLCPKTPIEILEESHKETDITCYPFVYMFTCIRYYIQSVCSEIVENSWFETVSLLVIMANCVILAMDDPTSSDQAQWQSTADLIFQALYTAEIMFKVLANGFVFNEGAYLRDSWNIMDFTIVIFGYLSLFDLGGGIDLKALRTFRILRPLRTISSVEELRILLSALITSLPMLMDTLIILLFFYMIFAIAGLQLWHGILRKRCFNIETGDLDEEAICGNADCPAGWTCVEGLGNPNSGSTHFDDIFTALLTVFQCVTMEGWTDTLYDTSQAFGVYAVIFYVPLILIGSLFLVNFTLAVIKSQVTKIYEDNRQAKRVAAQNKAKGVKVDPEELQAEAENKITVAQLLGVKSHGVDSYRKQIVPFSLQLHNPQNDFRTNNAFMQQMDFPDIDAEFGDSGNYGGNNSGKNSLLLKGKVAPIHEDVIREEDENRMDISSLHDEPDELLPENTPCRTNMTNVMPLSPATGDRPMNSRIVASPKPLEIPVENPGDQVKKVAKISGMAGIRKALPVGVKAAFVGLEGLDEFSETLFNQASPQETPRETLAVQRDQRKIVHQYSEVSSSLLDIDGSMLPSISKEATPSNNQNRNDFTPVIITPQDAPTIVLPHEIHQPFQSAGIGKKGTINKQTTIGTASSTSFTSANATIEANNKISPIKNKLASKNAVPLIKDETTDLVPPSDKFEKITADAVEENVLRAAAEAEGDKTDRAREELEKPKVEVAERPPEKFILTDGNIAISSGTDVLASTNKPAPLIVVPQDSLITTVIPPYKLKVLFNPTSMPEDEELDEKYEAASSQKKTISIQNKDSSSHADSSSYGLSRKSPSTVTKKSKGKKGKKGKKKDKKSETNSRAPSKQPSQKGSKADNKSVASGGSKVENKSQGGSVGSGTHKNPDGTSSGSPTPAEVNGEEEKGEKDAEGEDVIKEKPNRKIFAWSGQEVLESKDAYYAVYHTGYMNDTRLWKHGFNGDLTHIRWIVKKIMNGALMENFMNLLVMTNTVILALDRYQQPESEANTLSLINYVFTGIFVGELVAKLFALGLVGYLSDAMNYLDGAVVLFSIVEIIFLNGQGALAAFRTLRIFRVVRMIRTLRVLRVARLLRGLRSMQMIIEVIGKTIGAFGYIGMLMLIIIFIYALFGMQLFGGQLEFKGELPRQNFDSFNNAFLSMFQVLTMENWQDLLYSVMRATNPALASLYLITWIFIGNYILLNLFLAIMLDAFTEQDEEDDEETEEDDEEKIKASASRSNTGTLSNTIGASSSVSAPAQASKTSSTHGKSVPSTIKKQATMNDDDFDGNDITEPQKEEEFAPFNNLKCDYSLYIFSKENCVRRLFWQMCSATWFEGVVLTLICVGSIKLAVDTFFLNNPNDTYTVVSDGIDMFFTIIFAVEALIKIIAFGFVFEPTTYLRDDWNQLDFFIVVASIIDAAVSSINIPMIKILRLLRTFRPLRFVTHNVNMRIIVTALFKSLGAIFNTLIVVLVIWLMFSIVGVNFFAGKFQYCSIDKFVLGHRQECEAAGGQWRTYDHNFDNSINGLIFLFVLTTQEAWPILVYQAVDCADVDEGPNKGGQWYYAYYFVIFLMIGSMFLLNLFVGVMFVEFTRVQKKETSTFGDIIMTEAQLNWLEIHKMILRAEPDYNSRTVPPTFNWRKPFHEFVTSIPFELFIAAIILLNMALMGMFYEEASETYLMALDIINYIFTGIFTVELMLKLCAYSWDFWYDAWNVFDFIIVVCSFVDIIFSNVGGTSLKMLRIGPQLIRVLRVLRVSRLLRLVKKYKRLQDIMEIIQLCLPSMMNVFSLLALVLFIYAVLGCYLFGDVTEGDAINEFYNFGNFANSILLCFKLATGDDWNRFMFDCARTTYGCAIGLGCGNPIAFVYFLSLKLVITFIMMNLFILIVLQLFEKFFISKENILSKFKEDFAVFQEVWKTLAPTHFGLFINQGKLIKFFGSITAPMGMEGMNRIDMIKEIVRLKIPSNENKDVFFNALLYYTMLRQYYERIKGNDFVRRKDMEMRRKINAMAEKAIKKAHYKTSRKNAVNRANPFVSLMILRMTVKLWKKYRIEHEQRVKEYAEKGIENYASDKEEDLMAVHISPQKHSRKLSNSRDRSPPPSESLRESLKPQSSSRDNNSLMPPQ